MTSCPSSARGRRAPPKCRCRGESQPSGRQGRGEDVDPFVTGQACRVEQTGLNVFDFEPRVALQEGCGIIAGSKHVEHVFDGETTTANDRLAAKDLWIEGDTFEQLFLIQGGR